MSNFLKGLPVWNDPGVEPPQTLKDDGWRIAQRPPASYFDWLQHTTYQALKELQENAAHISDVGELAALTTTAKNTIIAAINELDAEHGVLSSLTTTAKNTLVAAINEINGEADANATNIGTLANLITTAKTNIVAAINEVEKSINDLDAQGFGNDTAVYTGDLDTLKTNGFYYAKGATNGPATVNGYVIVQVYQSGYVKQIYQKYVGEMYYRHCNDGVWSAWIQLETTTGAQAKVDAAVGTLANLTTTAKDNLVNAINEIDGIASEALLELGDISTLTTNVKTSAVAAINELELDARGWGSKNVTYTGDLNNLKTNGFYYSNATSGDASNRPGSVNGYVMVHVLDSNYVSQFYQEVGGSYYYRVCSGGTWKAWTKVATESYVEARLLDDVGTLANLTTTQKDNVIAAINEIDAEVADVAGDVGDITTLTTTTKTSTVEAINEINGKFVEIAKGTFTASGDGLATTAIIPHGLSSLPTFYQVQEASADAGNADISFVEVDTTNITVTFKNALASGTDNIKLVWRAE